MAANLTAETREVGTEPSLTSLVTGILNDSQELFKQQFALLKTEVSQDFRKTKEAARSLVLALAFFLLGGGILALMAVHLVQWAFPELPHWVSHAVVGLALAGIGGVLYWAGVKRLESVNPLPDESIDTLKENAQWIVKPK